jgi:hypothetical protein
MLASTLLAGCKLLPPQPPDLRPEDRVQRMAPAAETTRALAAGDSVALRNGLTFTVPRDWEGTLTAYSSVTTSGDPQPPTPYNSEYVLLHRTGATAHPSTVMLYSRGESSTPLPRTSDKGFTRVLASEVVAVWMSPYDFPKPPQGLFVADTLYLAVTRESSTSAARAWTPEPQRRRSGG